LGGNRLDVSGNFGKPGDKLSWSIDAPNLQVVGAGLSGAVRARGSFAGEIHRPAITFTLAASRLTAGGFHAGAIDAKGELALQMQAPLRLTAHASGLRHDAVLVNDLKLQVQGTSTQHELTAALRAPKLDASLSASGGLDQNWQWRGRVNALEAAGRFALRLAAPAQLSVGPGLLEIEGLQAIALGGQLGPASLRIARDGLATRGSFTALPLRALLAFAPATTIEARDAMLGAQWNFTVNQTLAGDAALRLEKGDITLKTEPKLALGLQQFRVALKAAHHQIEASGEARSARLGTVTARARTRVEPRANGWVLPRGAPLEGDLQADIQSLSWARAFFTQVDVLDGRAHARLKLGGTLGKPAIAGEAAADQLQARVLEHGLHFTNGMLRATFDGSAVKLVRYALTAGEGRIEGEGVADLADGLRSLSVQLRATRARMVSTPQLNVVLSGSAQAGLRERKLAIDGKFRIDEGRYDLGHERRPELGDDVVIVGKPGAPAPAARAAGVLLDVVIELNDRFTVRGRGLDALLGGSLRATTRNGVLQALGTIHAVRGEFSAFGEPLAIERGRLNFTGPLTNPGLDIRAGREIRTVQVGVEATVSLQRPIVTLVSDPVMSDTERLGWLVLGYDPQTAGAAQLAVLQAAALTLNRNQNTPIQRQLAEGLGLDHFGFTRAHDGAIGVLALGKRITERLSVRLEQSIGGTAASILKVDYLLSPRWRFEGSAGAQNAADILFSWRFD